MKAYHGLTGGRVSVIVDGESYPLDPRVELAYHKGGFAWGYAGSGPAHLALAILADYTADDEFAVLHAAEFSRLVIANLSLNAPFIVDGAEVGSFVSRVRPGAHHPEGDTS